MRLRNKLGITLISQILGVGATALANIVVANRYGPDGQGYLSYYRSTVDFFSNLGLFGFPQAFVYMINSKIIDADWACKFSTAYTLLFGFIYVSVGAFLYLSSATNIKGFDGIALFSIIVAATCMLLHGLYRAISLSSKPIYIFNINSAAPAILAFLIYFFWHAENFKILVLVMVAASVISCLIAAFFLKENLFSNYRLKHDSISKIKQAVRYGFWSFIPNISLNLVMVSTYGLLRQGGSAEATAGYFSISFLLLYTGILPLNMIVPVLFDAWSKEFDRKNSLQSYLKFSHLGSLLAIIGFSLGMMIVEPLTKLVFGADFLPSVLSTKILLLAIYAFYQNRLLSAMLLAIGNPASVGIGAVIRALIIILPMSLGLANSLLGAALVWGIGEFASTAYMLFFVWKKTGWSFPLIAGISLPWIVKALKSVLRRIHNHYQL